ncbi:uncharacterized protein LOC135496088 [Lineus longissimus]|uniref:uncharacterized protein LOC135496088 n=1 Tax=Lineus longissimus TaxID=88925 RepID=UPI00315C532E
MNNTMPLDKTKFIDFGITPLLKKCELDRLKTKFLPVVVRKFSHVPLDVIEDITFLTSDSDFCLALQKLSSQARDEFFAEDDEFRAQQFQIVANQPRMFYTFRKILEIALKDLPDVCTQPIDEEQELMADAKIAHVVCSLLVSGSDILEVFAKKLSYEPCLMELFARFVKEAKPGYFEDTAGLGTKIILDPIMTIIHNCASFKSNRGRLVQAGVLDELKPYLEKQDGIHESEIVQSVAFIADDEDAQLFKMKREVITDDLVVKLKECMKSERRKAGGWNVLELIKGLGRLALNGDNRAVMRECGVVTLMLDLMRSKVKSEQYEALCALWTLSRDPTMNNTIAADSDAIRRITELSSESPKDPQEVAVGLLENIKRIEI